MLTKWHIFKTTTHAGDTSGAGEPPTKRTKRDEPVAGSSNRDAAAATADTSDDPWTSAAEPKIWLECSKCLYTTVNSTDMDLHNNGEHNDSKPAITTDAPKIG